MTTYQVAKRSSEHDTGNGARGASTYASSGIGITDESGNLVAWYSRDAGGFGRPTRTSAVVTDADGTRRMLTDYHAHAAGHKTLRSFFKAEVARLYDVKVGR